MAVTQTILTDLHLGKFKTELGDDDKSKPIIGEDGKPVFETDDNGKQVEFKIPDPAEDLEGFKLIKSEIEKNLGIASMLIRRDMYNIQEQDVFTPEQIELLHTVATGLRISEFKEGGEQVDFETEFLPEHEFAIIPAGNMGAKTRGQYLFDSIDSGKTKVTNTIILVGSRERNLSADERKEYFSLIVQDDDSRPLSEYDLIHEQAEKWRTEYSGTTDGKPKLNIVDLGAVATDGDDKGVYTYTVANKALNYLRDRLGAEQMKGMNLVFVTNQIYQISNQPDMVRAAENHGVESRPYVVGFAGKNPRRNAIALFKEILTVMRGAGSLIKSRSNFDA